jgi:hypothetical protein
MREATTTCAEQNEAEREEARTALGRRATRGSRNGRWRYSEDACDARERHPEAAGPITTPRPR